MTGSSKLGALGVVVFLAASHVACGNARAGAGSDGGGATGSAASAGSAGGGAAGTGGAPLCGVVSGVQNSGTTCNVIAASGPCVTATFSTATAPTPAGGAFAAGTYNLTSETFYGSAQLEATFLPGQPFRRTYVLSDVTSTSFTLDLVETLGTYVARAHETVAVSGMTATFTQICPPADAGAVWGGSDDFTATSTSITLIRPVTGVSGLIDARVYDKAP
jgi:hypothetical protein